MSKKYLEIWVLLTAILALSGAASAATGETSVSASMGAHIWIESPKPVTLNLAPDETAQSEQTINVKTNKDQDWTVSASISTDNGKLYSTILSAGLENYLVLNVDGWDQGALAKTGVGTTEIYDDPDTLNHKTGGTQRQIATIFKQQGSYEDGITDDYDGTITFTAAYKVTGGS